MRQTASLPPLSELSRFTTPQAAHSETSVLRRSSFLSGLLQDALLRTFPHAGCERADDRDSSAMGLEKKSPMTGIVGVMCTKINSGY